MKKVKNWFVKNKDELLVAWGTMGTLISLLLILVTITMMAISEDLVEVVNTRNKEIAEKEAEIETLTYERNYYYYLTDELEQTYEDVIPKGQYIQDIEYLESVILELREQCETYNNKEN